jgi:hypothetical protein
VEAIYGVGEDAEEIGTGENAGAARLASRHMANEAKAIALTQRRAAVASVLPAEDNRFDFSLSVGRT